MADNIDDGDLVAPLGACGSGTRKRRRGCSPPSAASPGSGAGTTSTGASGPDRIRPSARARASTTSPTPPVLAQARTRRRLNATASSDGTGLGRYDALRWSPGPAFRRCRASRFGSHRSSKASVGLPATGGGAWHPAARVLFSRLDGAAWARYRNSILLLEGRVRWAEVLENPDLIAEYQSIVRELDAYMDSGSDHWFHREYPRRTPRSDRLLLRRVRIPRIAGDLLGRSRCPGRRPHEVGQRHGPAVCGRRPAVSARATSARRSTPTGTRNTPIPTSTSIACRSSGRPTPTVLMRAARVTAQYRSHGSRSEGRGVEVAVSRKLQSSCQSWTCRTTASADRPNHPHPCTSSGELRSSHQELVLGSVAAR